jgi:hypothetical protein
MLYTDDSDEFVERAEVLDNPGSIRLGILGGFRRLGELFFLQFAIAWLFIYS